MVAKCHTMVRKWQEAQDTRKHTCARRTDNGAGTRVEAGQLPCGEGWGTSLSPLPGTLPLGSQLQTACAETPHAPSHLFISLTLRTTTCSWPAVCVCVLAVLSLFPLCRPGAPGGTRNCLFESLLYQQHLAPGLGCRRSLMKDEWIPKM